MGVYSITSPLSHAHRPATCLSAQRRCEQPLPIHAAAQLKLCKVLATSLELHREISPSVEDLDSYSDSDLDFDSESDSGATFNHGHPASTEDSVYHPVEGYENCQIHFNNDHWTIESDGNNGGEAAGAADAASALSTALPAVSSQTQSACLDAPGDKPSHVFSECSFAHCTRPAVPTVNKAQCALADLMRLLEPSRASG